MNKTKVTTRKGSKTKSKKESPEVYVLPPNLLEKLGIHLENYGSAPESTVGSQVTGSNLISAENEFRVNKFTCKKNTDHHVTASSEMESSIIETAELMKKSVFLSPTFISNNTSVIQGEIEIVGNTETEGIEAKKAEGQPIEIHMRHVCVSNLETSSSNTTSLFTQESIQSDQIANDIVEINDVEMQTLLDDHADEAYSSDCSNSNMGCAVQSELKSRQNKINIISDHIIPPSQFYKLKNNYSPKDNSFIHVSTNNMVNSPNDIQNSVNQNDLGFIHNVDGNIVPSEITVVSEDDVNGQHSVEGDSILLMEVNEILQNVNKTDLCAVLNEAESEFIITTQNQDDSQQDIEVLQNPCKNDVITNDDVSMDTSIVVPCLIDVDHGSNTMYDRKGDFSTNKQVYSEHSDNAVKEAFNMYDPDSCIEEKKIKNMSETLSNKSQSDILVDSNENSVMSCIVDSESESKMTHKYPHVKVNSQTEYITSDKYAYQEVIYSKKEFITLEQSNIEQPSISQNLETDSIDHEKAHSMTDNKETNKSVLENPPESGPNTNINKAKCSSDTLQMKRNKNDPAQKTSTSPIFYVRRHNKPVFENNEIDEYHGKQKNGHEDVEPHEIKESDTASIESNKLKAGHKNNVSSIQEDKVREIAKYLSEFADMKKRNHFINRHKIVSTKTLSNKKGPTCTKSSIQGVEKPGGSEINKQIKQYPPIKTYGRMGIQTCKSIPSYVFEESNITTQSINMTDSTSSKKNCYDMQECLCYDFGRLKYYDDIGHYEHIHFWNNANINCSPESIFSIYREDASPATTDNEVINVIEEYSSENSHETLYKLCWNELQLIDEYGFDDCNLSEETELVKNHLFAIDKKISAGADSKNEENKKCNEKQDAEKDVMCQNNKIITVDSVQKCEVMPNNKIFPDEHSAKSGRNRKRSIVLDGIVVSPTKNRKRRISNRLSHTKEGYTYIDEEEQNITNSMKISPNNLGPLKAPSTPLFESTTLAEQACTFSSKTSNSSRELSSASFHDIIVTGATWQHQTGSCISVNESTSKRLIYPTTTLNEASNTREPETRIPATTRRLTKEENINKTIICGRCQQSVEGAGWLNHIAAQHNYLAWKSGEPSLDVDDETAVREHLYGITKSCGGLTCAKCGLTRKYVKAYLSHVRSCTGVNENSSELTPGIESVDFSVKSEGPANDGLVKCGVCEESIQDTDWNDHRASRHDYLAWKFGESPLDVNNEATVRDHLYEITKACGGLTCAKCGLTRKYVKAYLSHIRSCTGLSESQNDSAYDVSSEIIPEVRENDTVPASIGSMKCGVCHESLEGKDWNHHIAARHDYLAWKLGDPPLDVNDESAVRNHLNEIAKTCGGLTCAKCGLIRKYVRAYLSHIKRCDGLNESQNDSAYNVSSDEIKSFALVNSPLSYTETAYEEAVTSNVLVKCAVCDESVQEKDWYSHIAAQHDYLAWKIGDTILDVNDEAAVRQHLYEITKACGGLTCAKCGLTRKYVKAYLSHVKTCNGSDNSRNDSSCNISTDVRPGMESVGLVNESISEIKQETSLKKGALVTCAVCEESVPELEWYIHIGNQHDYLAWKLDEPSLDVNDESAVYTHLYIITNECGGLTCSRCGLTRKYVKAYLKHLKNCDGLNDTQNDISMCLDSTEVPGVDLAESVNSSTNDVNEKREVVVKCAVCAEYVLRTNWNSHIASQHDYLAWKEGEKCLDVQDEEAVRQHLHHIKRQNGGLTCAKCGTNMKYVESYLNHVKSCQIPLSGLEDSSQNLVLETRASENEELMLTTPVMDPSLVKCGVCGQYSAQNDWRQHIADRHEYLAWKDGQPPLNIDDEKEVRGHLRNILREFGILTCPKCEVPHKTVKSYVHHIKVCGEAQEDMKSSFKCGVCAETVISLQWENHLSEKHDYVAWKDGDTPVNVDDENDVFEHLYNLSKQFGSLFCNNCGLRRKYVKSYKEHVKVCKYGVISKAASVETVDDSGVDFTSGGTCAVCHKEVEAGKWIQHTQRQHNYLAWREGEKPWNLDDFDDVNQYLYVICKKMDGLTCNKCGIVRKYVKTYLTHIKSCDVIDFNLNSSVGEGIGPLEKDVIQCAICKEQMKPSDWKTHAMTKHYNITWIIGETPIDLKNPYAVERYLKEYKQVYGSLKCNACNASRASFAGFYAHIIVCGKTEEEIDVFRSLCDICNCKYLCIYKNQHAMIHKVQEYTAELKIKKAETDSKLNLPGKRLAAVKARSVIENYSDNMSKHAHACQSCGFGTDFENELKTHKCEVSNEKDFSGDESSAAEIGSSDDESGDTDVDSNISNEVNDLEPDDEGDDDDNDNELLIKKKIRHREPAPVLSKISRIPFKVDDPNSYIRQGDVDFCDTYMTDEVLFPQWQCKLETVLESEMARYLPPLEQSCKVKYDSGWRTLNRFEAKGDDNGTSIFVGASIVCIAWVPPRVEEIRDGNANFLAIACHNGPDCPRYQANETPKHENLIQIWNFSKFERLPQIVLGIAHDFGTVWSMDWCPSGARDTLDGGNMIPRLGLLAVACSSGSAYIFAVPYPSADVKNNQFMHKIKPVAELRMAMGSGRKLYQATSVSWSKQKGHSLVLVGYGDGSTAYYDLQSTSPLLLTVENGVQVFHPYNDERPHNTCITDTDLYPVSGDSAGGGAGAWSSPTGAELAARAGAGAAGAGRARLPAASLAVRFAPHACCAVLGGDDVIMHTAISEMAWVPPGRRLGSIRTTAGCTRCGRVVASTPPILRVMRPHPAYCDAKKQVVGQLEMTHLSRKRKKQVNDELAMIVEPLTYDDAITKYGITFQAISRSDKEMQQKCSAKPRAHCPERFPLADVKSMAFCPARRYHEKLALATHSGILFLMTIN